MASTSSVSDFPLIADGDVTLVIPPGDVYKLQSATLRRASGFFADVLTEENATKLKKSAQRAGISTRYKFELKPSRAYPNGMFYMKKLDRYGKPVKDEDDSGPHTSAYGSYLAPTTGKHWRNLLGAFYGRVPDINEDNLQTVLESSVGLVDIAESIRALPTIRQSVDIALIRHGQVLFRSIAVNPVEWGNLAIRIQSPSICLDAVIHLVGKWNQIPEEDRKLLNGGLRELCERKHDELEVKKKAIEIRILGHYSPSMYHKEDKKDQINRTAYGNDIYWWMAIDIFRQWFCQAVSDGRSRAAPDGGAAFYRTIGKGSAAYLDMQDYANFHNLFPMTAKGRSILYDKLKLLKHEIRKFAEPLLVNRSQLDIKAGSELRHLTCCDVTRNDMPWVVAPAADDAADDSTSSEEDMESDSDDGISMRSTDENAEAKQPDHMPEADHGLSSGHETILPESGLGRAPAPVAEEDNGSDAKMEDVSD